MNPNTTPENVEIKNNSPKMWLKMKTYEINSEADICNILVNNSIKHLNNSFEIPFKDVKKFTTRLNRIGMDMVLFDAHVVPLTMQRSNSSYSLVRENSENCFVSFVNVKNEKEEYLSSLVNNLSPCHRFVITNGVMLKNFSTFNNSKLTVAVRPENSSSVFLFKSEQCSKPLEHLDSLVEENLSKITNSGVYSLFGHITNITIYPDEEFMLLRIRCFDKCVIKFQKYPELVGELKKNISNEDKTLEVNYDFSSNSVDVLIKNPCAEFLTLKINQRICLYKVIVKYSNNFKTFSLYANGKAKNLKADPLETNSVKSVRPPNKQFPIPKEIMPLTRSKTKQMSSEEIPFSKDVLNNTKEPSSNVKETTTNLNKHQLLSSSSSDDDNVNLSRCQTSRRNLNVNNGANQLSYKTNNIIQKNVNICSPGKRTNLNSVNKVFRSTPKKQQLICSKRESSPDSTDGSCSPSFFKTSEISEFSQDNQSTKLQPRTIQRIGPCRLLSVELKMDDIVCGYCTKCYVFTPKTLLIKSDSVKYRCPNCSDSVSLTLFMKMTFLYESTDCSTIELCCYNKNAECVLKKLLKKNVKLYNFLKSSNYRQLFDNAVELLIKKHTKMNIVFCHSPMDNAYILQSLDTEFIVTNPINLI